jgi:hypothetical protein
VAAELNHLLTLVTASNLSAVDQTALRELSETVTADLADLGQQLGLQKPSLAN